MCSRTLPPKNGVLANEEGSIYGHSCVASMPLRGGVASSLSPMPQAADARALVPSLAWVHTQDVVCRGRQILIGTIDARVAIAHDERKTLGMLGKCKHLERPAVLVPAEGLKRIGHQSPR